jgi:PAS domain S-box-containing protein
MGSSALIVGFAVLAACALGIMSRPVGFLAMIWPANAVLLGLLIRLPDANRLPVWMSAIAAYMAADLIAGTDFSKSVLLNAANLSGVITGYLVYRLLPKNALSMREPSSVLYMALISVLGAIVAGLGGALTDPFVLQLGVVNSGLNWLATELVNYIALLPVILSAPRPRNLVPEFKLFNVATCVKSAVPALALAVSCAAAMIMGGPGAIAFVVPALLWCALAYSVFTVSILAFTVSIWSLTSLSAGYLMSAAGTPDEQAIVSLRLATFMIALAPITLSIVMRNREELLSNLSLARQRIDMALSAGGIVGTWDLDLTTNDLTMEGKLPTLFDTEHDIEGGILQDKMSNLIHPDDRERVYDALGAAVVTGSDYHCRYRVVAPSGEIHWWAAFGKTVRDREGAAARLIGILIDVTEQTEAVEALERSQSRFNVVSESIPHIVWSADAKGKHDYFNRRWTEFTGIELETVTSETWKQLVHPEDWPRVEQAWASSIATGEPYSIDYRYRYHDGGYRWLNVQAKALHNAQGAIIRWYGTSTDIDDVKRLEAEREIVTRELDHRIGNVFALVNGLVSLTAREGSDVKTVTDALRGRLKALHDAHSLIRRNNDGAGATIAELLKRLLAPYDSGLDHIKITGEDLPLAPSAMTSIALIFHELATNAVKYGALKDSGGLLRIDLDKSDDRFTIRWTEVTQTQTSTEHGVGFGSKLFNSIVEGQLRGKAERLPSSSGLRIDIDLPLSSLIGTSNKK